MLYHPDPTQFIAKSGDYGALGRAIVALSNLEFAHDNFVFKMHETNHELSLLLSKRFPRHFREKTDFLVNAVANLPKLRTVPIFQNGTLDLLWLQYQLDEIYEVRSIIAHGSIVLSESTPHRITWTLERFVQDQTKAWTRQAVKVSNGYLASVYFSAWLLKRYMLNLTECLENVSCLEQEYQQDKKIRANRKYFAELVSSGIVIDDNGWISAFPPLGPVN